MGDRAESSWDSEKVPHRDHLLYLTIKTDLGDEGVTEKLVKHLLWDLERISHGVGRDTTIPAANILCQTKPPFNSAHEDWKFCNSP